MEKVTKLIVIGSGEIPGKKSIVTQLSHISTPSNWNVETEASENSIKVDTLENAFPTYEGNHKMHFVVRKDGLSVCFRLNTDTVYVFIAQPGNAYQEESINVWKLRLAYRNEQKLLTNTLNEPPNSTDFPYGEMELREFFQKYWEPTFFCNFPKRIGKIGDGGKWVCNPKNILEYKKKENKRVLVYSIGSNAEYSFEIGINMIFDGFTDIYTFDMKEPKEPPPIFINLHPFTKLISEQEELENHLKQKIAGPRQLMEKSLLTLTKDLRHEDNVIDILKIDIEGCSFN
ncbi:hypothetical protein HDU92_004649 [Lobulomyces angularis]|nr:hypothetical protein HDU92_004649 [Lobulomyces angularis]